MSSTLGTLNPLTYRGYVYDHETELYYVSSRYYNPAWGRFLNADVLISTGQGMLGNNMFAYCRNNPVNRIDISGCADTPVEESFDDDTEVVPTIPGGGGPGGSSGSLFGSQTGSALGSGNLGGDGSRANPYVGGTYPPGQYYPDSQISPYQSPDGGGGTTNTIIVDGVRIDFGHGGRHINTSEYNNLDIQEVIAHDVVNQPRYDGTTKNVSIIYGGRSILYSYHTFNQHHINVGTYFFMDNLK